LPNKFFSPLRAIEVVGFCVCVCVFDFNTIFVCPPVVKKHFLFLHIPVNNFEKLS